MLALLPVLVELSSEGESSLLSGMSAFTMAAVCCDWEAGGRGVGGRAAGLQASLTLGETRLEWTD